MSAIDTKDLYPNQRISFRAEWLRGAVLWGVVVMTHERHQGVLSGHAWMKKHGGLSDRNLLVKPDGDGHQRLVKIEDVLSVA